MFVLVFGLSGKARRKTSVISQKHIKGQKKVKKINVSFMTQNDDPADDLRILRLALLPILKSLLKSHKKTF